MQEYLIIYSDTEEAVQWRMRKMNLQGALVIDVRNHTPPRTTDGDVSVITGNKLSK